MNTRDDKTNDIDQPATKVFCLEDQIRFAALSRDYNPVHLDVEYARRTIFGGVAVHGIHLLLAALKESLPAGLNSISKLKAVFYRPVLVDAQADIKVTKSGAKTTCVIESEGIICTRLQFDSEPSDASDQNLPAQSETASKPLSPSKISIDDNYTANLVLNQEGLDALIPGLSEKLIFPHIASLLGCTYVVGMQCPGLNSIFSELRFEETKQSQDCIEAVVAGYDQRYGRVDLSFSANRCRGLVVAYVRPDQVSQPTYEDVMASVTPDKYADVRALVVGGSRGVGEVIAKVIAAGGGEVCCTYAHSAQAAKVLQELIGSEKCSIAKLDVTSMTTSSIQTLFVGFEPTHLFYLATPHIFGSQKNRISSIKLERFIEFYLRRFIELSNTAISSGVKNIFAPSTSALDDYPEAMAEYAIAKSAFEVACKYLSKHNKDLKISYPRLPRLDTDQTANISDIPSADTLTVVIDAVEEFVFNSP